MRRSEKRNRDIKRPRGPVGLRTPISPHFYHATLSLSRPHSQKDLHLRDPQKTSL